MYGWMDVCVYAPCANACEHTHPARPFGTLWSCFPNMWLKGNSTPRTSGWASTQRSKWSCTNARRQYNTCLMERLLPKELDSLLHVWSVMDALIWSKQLQHRGLCDCVQLEHSSFWVNPCDGCHVTGAGRCNTQHWMKRSRLSKVLQNISVTLLNYKVSCSKAFQEPATHHYRPPIPSCIWQVQHLISGKQTLKWCWLWPRQISHIGCWLDCGMTQLWQAGQMAQLPQSSWYLHLTHLSSRMVLYTVYVLKAMPLHVKLLCSTPCPIHPSDLSQTRITLTWSLDSCMNVLFAPVRANFPAQYIVSRKACWAIARVHFQPLLPSKIAPWHDWPVHMAEASQFAGFPMQQFMEVSVQDLVAAPSTSLYMNMCVTHW